MRSASATDLLAEENRRLKLAYAAVEAIRHDLERDRAALLVTKGNVCQLLDKMETSGLLERRPDKRVNRLFLTEQGRQVYEEVVPRHDALLAEQFQSLSEPDQRELLRLLRRLDHSLERD